MLALGVYTGVTHCNIILYGVIRVHAGFAVLILSQVFKIIFTKNKWILNSQQHFYRSDCWRSSYFAYDTYNQKARCSKKCWRSNSALFVIYLTNSKVYERHLPDVKKIIQYLSNAYTIFFLKFILRPIKNNVLRLSLEIQKHKHTINVPAYVYTYKIRVTVKTDHYLYVVQYTVYNTTKHNMTIEAYNNNKIPPNR